MIRLIGYLLFSLAVTLGVAWLLMVPGTISIEVAGYVMQPRIGVGVLALIFLVFVSMLLWTLLLKTLSAPKYFRNRAQQNKQVNGIDALSNALIALHAGDAQRARHLAREAQGKLPQNVAAQLLEARAELALGHWGMAREHYRKLIDNPKTSLAALSGLYEQAQAQNRVDAALTFAHKAHSLEPDLVWARQAIFEDLTRNKDWAGALKLVHSEPAPTRASKHNKKRRLAILHTAIAGSLEVIAPPEALDNARVALKLLPDFVPAVLIAARVHSNRGELRKSTSLLRRVWRVDNHPHVALLYANAQPGISPTERLNRLNDLIPTPPPDQNSAIIVAQIAIQAKAWDRARTVLAPYVSEVPSQGVCVAMAQVEEGQGADHGKARQWLARAVSAPRDPVWTADGVTAPEWAPVSPVSGELDKFEFKIPTSAVLSQVEDPIGQGLSMKNFLGESFLGESFLGEDFLNMDKADILEGEHEEVDIPNDAVDGGKNNEKTPE